MRTMVALYWFGRENKNHSLLCKNFGEKKNTSRNAPKFLDPGPARVLLSLANQVVYLGEDLHFEGEIVSEVVAAIKDFTGRHRVKAGLSQMVGSPTLALL